MGEFYNRMYKKSNPALVIGRSLFELLTKELRNETSKCLNDSAFVFSVQFARLLLTQVRHDAFNLRIDIVCVYVCVCYLTLKPICLQITFNGPLAKKHHLNEIETLFVDIRKCLIEVTNLMSVTKAFLLMSLDLYYNEFKTIDTNLEKFYGKFLDDHDNAMQTNRPPSSNKLNKPKSPEPPNSTYNLKNLRKDFAGLKPHFKWQSIQLGNKEEHRKINREYLNRPLKASDRLKYFQNSNAELTTQRHDDNNSRHPQNSRNLKESSSEGNISQHNSYNNNEIERNKRETTSSSNSKCTTPLTVKTNCQDSIKSDGVASSVDSQDIQQISPPKLENFNWFEAVEREEYGDYIPPSNNNVNNSSGSNKFDTMSLASYSSNATSPQDRVSPQSSHTNRSRRNSLNRFRSEYYRQSDEDLHQNDNNKRTMRNDSKQNYHNSWRNSGQNSPRNNDVRNGYNNKRNDYDRENSNNNGGNYNNRRNSVRGGSVDSNKVKDFNARNRHDSFNRRNQENDNFEHFQSYNRKTYSRSKDNFNRAPLPPRLQQKYQQQQQRSAEHKNNADCDNPKRFNNKGLCI